MKLKKKRIQDTEARTFGIDDFRLTIDYFCRRNQRNPRLLPLTIYDLLLTFYLLGTAVIAYELLDTGPDLYYNQLRKELWL